MANTLTFKYNANGGSGAAADSSSTYSPSSYPYTARKTVSGGTPTRAHYTFLGWSQSSGAASATYQNGSSYRAEFTANGQTITVTFYAVWQHITSYIYFDGNGGTGAPSRISCWEGTQTTLPNTIPVRDGYNFLGWATSPSATTAEYQAGGAFTPYVGTVTLYAVWEVAASKVTTTDGTMGTAQTLTITRQDASHVDTITYTFGAASGTIATQTSADTVSWTPPLSLAVQIPNAESAVCVLTCTSYLDDEIVGRSTTSINLSVPPSVKVEVDSVALAETVAAIASTFGAFVQSKSKLSVTVTPDTANAYGATVAAYSISINGQTLTENGAITSELVGSGTLAYSVTITDTRGRTDTYTGTYNVLAYTMPSITATAERSAATPSSIVVSYTFTVAAVGNDNTKSASFYYKARAAENYTLSGTITPSSYTETGTFTITGTDSGASTDVKIELSDYFTTVQFLIPVAAHGSRILEIDAVTGKVKLFNALDVGAATLTAEKLLALDGLLADVAAEGTISGADSAMIDTFEPDSVYFGIITGFNTSLQSNLGWVLSVLYTKGEDAFETDKVKYSRLLNTSTSFYSATYNTGSTITLAPALSTYTIKYRVLKLV